jgi:ABC transport system ATP-binding/permease protein
VIVVSHDRDFLDRVATSVLMHEGEGKWIEYAGGYSDMVAQRGEGVALRKAEKVATKTEARERAEVAPTIKRKLSFKEKHALETLPAKMDALQAELKSLEALLSDAGLFARDPKAFEKATSRHGVAAQELSRAEEQWLELELLRDELEG